MSKLEFDKLRIDIWISGSVDKEGNGGYCALLYSQLEGKPYTKTIGGYGKNTTLTRMHLKAIVDALSLIKSPSFIHIYTQLPQISSGLNKHIYEWEKQGWKRKDGEDLQHADLWERVYNLIKEKSLHYKVHYLKEADIDLKNKMYLIHKSAEFLLKAKKQILEVSLPI